MDIIVTTPKSEMANAAREAADCIAAGGGEYFRRFPLVRTPKVTPADRVYYVEDGYVRGFAVISRLSYESGMNCDTTGRRWARGWYVFMDANSWKWIRPIPMRGFQGFRYAGRVQISQTDGVGCPGDCKILVGANWQIVHVVGGWVDPKPARPGARSA